MKTTAKYIEIHTNSRAIAIQADLSKASDIQKVVNETINEFNKVLEDLYQGIFFDFSDEDWKYSFDLILLYVIRMCRLVMPYMASQKSGRIIIVFNESFYTISYYPGNSVQKRRNTYR